VAAEAVEAPDDVEADASGRGSDAAPAADVDADVGADFAQRPDVDAAPTVGEGVDEFEVPAGGAAAGVGAVVCAEDAAELPEAPDVGDGAGAGEPPGLAGRGGAFAAGGGEAAGAGRAGGAVGIADLDVGFGAGTEDDAAEVAAAEVVEAEEAAPAAVDAVDVDGAPDDVVGRLASVGAAAAGRVASAARAVGMFVIPELAGRVGAAPIDGAAVDAEAPAEPDAVVDPRVGLDAVPVGTAPVLVEGAGVCVAVPACVDWGGVDLGAADLLEVNGVGSVVVPDVDLRAVAAEADGGDDAAPEDGFAVDAAEAADPIELADAPEAVDPAEFADIPEAVNLAEAEDGAEVVDAIDPVDATEPVDTADPAATAELLDAADPLSGAGPAAGDPDDVAAVVDAPEAVAGGASDRVGGIGASADPRSAASNIGDAQVPEYALSVAASVEDEPDALVERAAASVDERPEAFAVVGFDPCPDAAAGTAGMPNPAGVLIASGAAEGFAADAL
jgi:hypothetical protein